MKTPDTDMEDKDNSMKLPIRRTDTSTVIVYCLQVPFTKTSAYK